MYGCVYYANQPSNHVNVAIQVGVSGTQCTDGVGNDVSFTMTNSGPSCYCMGYVVNKPYDTGGDNCAVVDSLWAVAYETTRVSPAAPVLTGRPTTNMIAG